MEFVGFHHKSKRKEGVIKVRRQGKVTGKSEKQLSLPLQHKLIWDYGLKPQDDNGFVQNIFISLNLCVSNSINKVIIFSWFSLHFSGYIMRQRKN